MGLVSNNSHALAVPVTSVGYQAKCTGNIRFRVELTRDGMSNCFRMVLKIYLRMFQTSTSSIIQ